MTPDEIVTPEAETINVDATEELTQPSEDVAQQAVTDLPVEEVEINIEPVEELTQASDEVYVEPVAVKDYPIDYVEFSNIMKFMSKIRVEGYSEEQMFNMYIQSL